MILLKLFPLTDAGGLFHFKKDQQQYSIKPEDYATKPLCVASKENQLRNEFFLYVATTCWRIFTKASASATSGSDSPVTTLTLSKAPSSVSTP